MSDRVSADHIEQLVGAPRHPSRHLGRAVTSAQTVYILHSQRCLKEYPDLRVCPYSEALDRGIDPSRWLEDRPVILSIGPSTGQLYGELQWMRGLS